MTPIYLHGLWGKKKFCNDMTKRIIVSVGKNLSVTFDVMLMYLYLIYLSACS